MRFGTLLAFVTAPVWVPALFAVAAVDTLVFNDRTTLANDLHEKLSDLHAELDGIERP